MLENNHLFAFDKGTKKSSLSIWISTEAGQGCTTQDQVTFVILAAACKNNAQGKQG